MVERDEPSPWWFPDIAADEAGDAPVRQIFDIAAYAGVPLRSSDGTFMGTLCAIDPTVDPAPVADLLSFAEHFAAHVLEEHAAEAPRQRRAERRLLVGEGDGDGPTVVPKASWPSLLAAESDRTTWSGERLTVALARIATTGGRPSAIAQVADRVAELLGEDDAVTVLGSNRLGVLGIDRPWAELEALLARAAPDGAALRVVGAEVAGPATAGEVAEELEAALVGSAAPARSASGQVRYEFCPECGRKGRYRRPGADLLRCKYCGAASVSP
jgi:hypothetical protein